MMASQAETVVLWTSEMRILIYASAHLFYNLAEPPSSRAVAFNLSFFLLHNPNVTPL
jgi:hypothetical protein